jgi:general secretion pathway protein G
MGKNASSHMTAGTRRRRAMLARIQAARENESGFTLIELLIVIVILGVLSGIVVFSVSGISNRGNEAACDATEKTVQVASEAFYARDGSYATDMEALVSGGFLQSEPTNGVTYAAGVVDASECN